MLSIIIPTLDAAASLASVLRAVNNALVGEVIVVDGGSGDDTCAVAARAGATVIAAPLGRGAQLAAGASAAAGDWLLFLHADTVPERDWVDEAASFIAAPENHMRAGYFRFRLDDAAPAARRLERAVAWRCRVLGLPFGDQGLLLSRDLYRAAGGYRALPLMEDVDLVRRIGRHRLVALAADAVTSAARYRGGYWRRSMRNGVCLALYGAGVPPRLVARLYG